MKPNEDPEDCQCVNCFMRKLTGMMLEHCSRNDVTVYEAVGLLEAVKKELLEIVEFAQEEDAEEPKGDN